MPGDFSESHSLTTGQAQTKICALCHRIMSQPGLELDVSDSPFSDDGSVLDVDDSHILCASCKEKQVYSRGNGTEEDSQLTGDESSLPAVDLPSLAANVFIDRDISRLGSSVSLGSTNASQTLPSSSQSVLRRPTASDVQSNHSSRETHINMHCPEPSSRPCRPVLSMAEISNVHVSVSNLAKPMHQSTTTRASEASSSQSPSGSRSISISRVPPPPKLSSYERNASASSSISAVLQSDAKDIRARRGSPTSQHPPLISHPMIDITHLRVPCQSYGCLYPGAKFQGTQKSGRSSYDVDVTIVDVDFSSSFLCGYLRIRGLTDDWPEMTTYFDAQIIGNRYGFLTQEWGATEQEDMVHWARFPAFQQVKTELKEPMLTMDWKERGAVFMRWKERFLVPDHRVEDISGASFAGFYYVCVDFNPPRTPSVNIPISPSQSLQSPTYLHPPEMPPCPETAVLESTSSFPLSTSPIKSPEIDLDLDADINVPVRIRRRSTSRQRNNRNSSSGANGRRLTSPVRPHTFEEPVASMCGYYYHQNSEPYQQLSLTHVKRETSSCFEFR